MTPRRLGFLAALRRAAQPLPAGVEVQRDLPYGPHPRQVLDLYRPQAAGQGPRPLVLFVHGGGWRRGDKAMPRMVQHKVAHWVPRGWLFAAMNYRLWPDADVPTQAEDVARALAFVQQQADRWGVDDRRIALIGHSAGAQLAALTVATPPRAAALAVRPWRATVVIDTAALDMVAVMQRAHYGFYDPVFGSDPAYWRACSATLQMQQAPMTPVLLVCAEGRDDVRTAVRGFAARARALGGRVATVQVPLGHLQINDALGADPAYTAVVDRFLDDPERETPQGMTEPPL